MTLSFVPAGSIDRGHRYICRKMTSWSCPQTEKCFKLTNVSTTGETNSPNIEFYRQWEDLNFIPIVPDTGFSFEFYRQYHVSRFLMHLILIHFNISLVSSYCASGIKPNSPLAKPTFCPVRVLTVETLKYVLNRLSIFNVDLLLVCSSSCVSD